MEIVYIGPSWGVRSFDDMHGTTPNFTNLSIELQLEVTNLCKLGASNGFLLKSLKKYLRTTKSKDVKVLWLLCEPLLDLQVDIITNTNWKDIRLNQLHSTIDDIASIDANVALIGAHSDAPKNNKLHVIDYSWQSMLCSVANVDSQYVGWGADVMHRYIMQNPHIKPHYSAVEDTLNTFKTWHTLEEHNLFNYVHATTLGNELYARYIKNNVYSWLKIQSQC